MVLALEIFFFTSLLVKVGLMRYTPESPIRRQNKYDEPTKKYASHITPGRVKDTSNTFRGMKQRT